MSLLRNVTGREFQRHGPATGKLLSPRRVRVLLVAYVKTSVDRSDRRPISVKSWQSSARYCGSWPCNALYTSTMVSEIALPFSSVLFNRQMLGPALVRMGNTSYNALINQCTLDWAPTNVILTADDASRTEQLAVNVHVIYWPAYTVHIVYRRQYCFAVVVCRRL